MPRKFDQDAKDRVVRLVEDRILAENMSMQAACQEVAPKLGSRGTQLVNGLKPARRSGNIPESVPEDLVAENARLRREDQVSDASFWYRCSGDSVLSCSG